MCVYVVDNRLLKRFAIILPYSHLGHIVTHREKPDTYLCNLI